MLERDRRTANGVNNFRPDIQGLRAIAVLAVVLYHAQLPGLTGGFIGVDIFFVISGYLICGLLQRELVATGRIDLAGFWLKRARRLLPNALLILCAVLIATALLRPGFNYPVVARSVMAAALSFANLHFAARDVDYFADQVRPNPVLHFWSLGVEEQFYVVWPVLLALVAWCWRRSAAQHAVAMLGAVWLLSFAAAMIAIRFDQPLAFYHAEMRAWQLATGGLIAALQSHLAITSARLRVTAGWLGLGGMAIGFATYNEMLTYPGVWALLPTLSTAAVLAAPIRAGSWYGPSVLLSLAPLRWIGDRSYSLYLWHWPVLVFLPALLPGVSWSPALALLLATAIACAAYSCVELPIRELRLGLAPRWPGFAVAAASIAVVLVGTTVLTHPIWPRDKAVVKLERMLKQASTERGRNFFAKCHRTLLQADQPLCAFGDVTATRTAVLLGDSHASQWFAAVDQIAKANGWRLLSWTKSACPIADVPTWNQRLHSRFAACENWRAEVMARLTGADRPQKVLLSSSVDLSGAVLDPETGVVLSQDDGLVAWREGMVRTLRKLQAAGIEPVVIADIPRAELLFADCLAAGRGAACSRPRAEAVLKDRPDTDAATQVGAMVLDLTDRICGPTSCPTMRDGVIVYRDNNHLTTRFVRTLAVAFEAFLPKAQPADEDMAVASIGPLRR